MKFKVVIERDFPFGCAISTQRAKLAMLGRPPLKIRIVDIYNRMIDRYTDVFTPDISL